MSTAFQPGATLRPIRSDEVARRWAAVQHAAGVVAGLAGVDAGEATPAGFDRVPGWRLALIDQGLADLAAILETGIRALLNARGAGDPVRVAARALWGEFVEARVALQGLAGPD